MNAIDPNTVTTQTHTISAHYAINGVDGHHVDINGDTLAEIISDMVDFWNTSDGRATEFELDRIEDNDGDATAIISGEAVATDADGEPTDDMDAITVYVVARSND